MSLIGAAPGEREGPAKARQFPRAEAGRIQLIEATRDDGAAGRG